MGGGPVIYGRWGWNIDGDIRKTEVLEADGAVRELGV